MSKPKSGDAREMTVCLVVPIERLLASVDVPPLTVSCGSSDESILVSSPRRVVSALVCFALRQPCLHSDTETVVSLTAMSPAIAQLWKGPSIGS